MSMKELQTIGPYAAESVALADLAARIRQEHAAVIIAARTTLQHALNAGDLLIAAKEQVAHGYFGD
jgi:hypothetical protein